MSLRTALALVCLAATISGCATKQTQEPKQTRELYVVMPEEGGKVGSLVVTRNGQQILLEGPYRALSSASINPFEADPNQVARLFDAALAATPLRPVNFVLLFIEGSDELVPQSKAEAEKMFLEIARRPVPEITIVGHTDTVGSDAFNDTLSIRRAQRIRRELIARGIPVENINAVGRGRRELLVPTPANVREARNRRVEINVR